MANDPSNRPHHRPRKDVLSCLGLWCPLQRDTPPTYHCQRRTSLHQRNGMPVYELQPQEAIRARQHVIANMWKVKDRICLLALMSYWYYKGHQSVNSDNRWCPHFWHNLLLQVRHCLCEDTASWMDLRVITESLFYILPFCIVMVGYSILWALYCTTSIKIKFMSSSYLLFLFRGFPPLRRSDVSDHFFFTAACALFWPNEVHGTPPHCHSFF